MADYHVQEYVREINFAAVKLAREVADEFTALTPDKPRLWQALSGLPIRLAP